jgi:predicted nuclease of restriction endonuclease-like (RecB) superfamily
MTNLTLHSNTESFIGDIKQLVEQGRNAAYGAVNAVMIETYWRIGQRIVEQEQKGKERAEYGTQLIKSLSEVLVADYGNNFNEKNLRAFRNLYLLFNDLEIWNTRVPNLTWSHYRTLLRVVDANARYWYLHEASKEMWSVRTLDRNIASQYYYRLLQSPNKDAVIAEMREITSQFQADKREIIKSPVVAEFLGLPSNAAFTETELEQAIIHHLKDFLLEMGKGFAFVAEQQHIRTDENDYFIDLVFYNYLLKSFVLIDLKTTRLSYQDVGQMDMYLQMYDDMRRSKGDNPTIGIILCSETNGDVVRYSTLARNDKMFAAKYLTYMPTEDELRREIEQQKELYRLQIENK